MKRVTIRRAVRHQQEVKALAVSLRFPIRHIDGQKTMEEKHSIPPCSSHSQTVRNAGRRIDGLCLGISNDLGDLGERLD
jgi:hypothetical protein